MRWLMSAGACFLFAASLQAAEAKLGLPAPDIPLKAPWHGSLSDLRGKKVLVLLTNLPPARLSEICTELKRRKVDVVIAPAQGADSRSSWLVDDKGIVRRIDPLPSSAKGLVGLLREWETGKAAFEYGCARCHAEDGKDSDFGVKPLAGVGNRMTSEQILSLLSPSVLGPNSYLIRNAHFTGRELEALLVYVRGL